MCHVDRLPDHLVVRIFDLLETEDIAFLLPRVCKRWSHLACSEGLWKDSRLFYSPYTGKSQTKLFYKCLKMAPCLQALTLEVDYKHGAEFALKFNVNSPPEIKEVQFIYDNMPPEVMFTLLRKYKNHLEKLTINDTMTPYVDSDVRRIWTDIQNLSKLRQLVVDGCALFYNHATFRKTAPCWKTLQVLDVKDCSYEGMNTVQRLISVNPNWTEVYLSTPPEVNISRGEVKALAKCNNLECAQVPFCKELKLLQKCEKLESLIIDCLDSTAKEINGVLATLEKSTVFPNLKKIKMIDLTSSYVKLLISLVKGRPAINLMTLMESEISATELSEVLKCVPELETLYLHSVSSESLLAVLDEMADGLVPKLKKFSLSECYCHDDSKKCLKFALNELQEKRLELKLDLEIVGCKCKPEDNKTSRGKGSKKQDINSAGGKNPDKEETTGDQVGDSCKETSKGGEK